ncbi:MAG: YcxB family protein [Lachnospiraceae bacterium]
MWSDNDDSGSDFEENNMQFDISLTKDDYIEFNMYHLKHSAMNKKLLNYRRRSIPLPLASVLFLLIVGDADPLFIKFMLLFFVIVSVTWIANCDRIAETIFIRRLEKQCVSGKALYSGFSKLTFMENTILEETEDKKLEIKYGKIQKLATNDDFLYLYHMDCFAFAIPDYVFENDVQKQQFVVMMEEKTGLKFE